MMLDKSTLCCWISLKHLIKCLIPTWQPNYVITACEEIHWTGQSFLSNRTQEVVLEGKRSFTAAVTSGVPQGTVLGPILFLCYINDLPDQVSSTARLFADDCLLYRNINATADADTLQDDIDRLQKWEADWLMEFNPDK